jgi:hypothetical protein
LAPEKLDDELTGSRQDLEQQLGEPVETVAYPRGTPVVQSPAIVAALERAGYALGFTSRTGVNPNFGPTTDRFDVRRQSMERGTKQAMFEAQLVIPRLAYARAAKSDIEERSVGRLSITRTVDA